MANGLELPFLLADRGLGDLLLGPAHLEVAVAVLGQGVGRAPLHGAALHLFDERTELALGLGVGALDDAGLLLVLARARVLASADAELLAAALALRLVLLHLDDGAFSFDLRHGFPLRLFLERLDDGERSIEAADERPVAVVALVLGEVGEQLHRTSYLGACEGDAAQVVSVGREVLAQGLVCANAKYNGIQCNPWADFNKQVLSVRIAADMSALPAVNTNYWFYACSALTSVAGMGNLRGVSLMQFTFNACSALTELDMRGLDPSGLTNVSYLFGGCSALKTILMDADWALPKSGLSGMATFYNCKAIVGGNGTTYSSSNYGYAMMRVDTAGAAGYLTAG